MVPIAVAGRPRTVTRSRRSGRIAAPKQPVVRGRAVGGEAWRPVLPTWVAEGRWTQLKCWELAFVAIGAVAVAMDFDNGASYDETVDLVAGQASG